MMSHPLEKSFSKYFETVLVPSEDGLAMIELKEYYADFFLSDYYVRAEITAFKTIQGIGEKFTVYVIQVELPFTKYNIEKRYNLFLELYKKIDRNYKNIGLENTTFPAKKLFGSLTQSTIEHRKIHLNNFLVFLCQVYKKEEMIEFLEFLEIKKRLEMLKRNRAFESVPKLMDYPEKNSRDDDQALRFLIIFNRKPKILSKSFKDFDSYFIEKRPRLSKQAIKKLFYVKIKGADDLQGLIHLCGKFDFKTDSHFTCGTGLNLIVKLLDYEYNKGIIICTIKQPFCIDAEYYNQIFGSTNNRDMPYLYLEHHIQGKGLKSCKVPALKLLYIFMNFNPNLSISQLVDKHLTIYLF